jgi:hypothetical protein
MEYIKTLIALLDFSKLPTADKQFIENFNKEISDTNLPIVRTDTFYKKYREIETNFSEAIQLHFFPRIKSLPSKFTEYCWEIWEEEKTRIIDSMSIHPYLAKEIFNLAVCELDQDFEAIMKENSFDSIDDEIEYLFFDVGLSENKLAHLYYLLKKTNDSYKIIDYNNTEYLASINNPEEKLEFDLACEEMFDAVVNYKNSILAHLRRSLYRIFNDAESFISTFIPKPAEGEDEDLMLDFQSEYHRHTFEHWFEKFNK